MALTLSFDFEDAALLYHTGMDAAVFRSEDQAGRFDYMGRNKPDLVPDMTLALPEYDEGCLLWCACGSDALLLKKIMEAAGHSAVIFGDNAAEDSSEVYVVLTSWNFHENEPKLTEEPVVAELLLNGDEEDDPVAMRSEALAVLRQAPGLELLGEPTVEDHDDHFHITIMVQVPGTGLTEAITAVARATVGSVGYNVLGTA